MVQNSFAASHNICDNDLLNINYALTISLEEVANHGMENSLHHVHTISSAIKFIFELINPQCGTKVLTRVDSITNKQYFIFVSN